MQAMKQLKSLYKTFINITSYGREERSKSRYDLRLSWWLR